MLNRLKILVFIFLFLGTVSCAKKQHNLSRKNLFDFNWKFYPGQVNNAFQIDFSDEEWVNLDLPHNWNGKSRQVDYASTSLSVLPESRTGWYRKHFNVPKNWADKQISIDFEGISAENEVFVNGVSVAGSRKVKNTFQSTLNPYLNYSGKNVIAVRVTIPEKGETGGVMESGIYKHVWLVIEDTRKSKN